jgi:GNAT superfamily N-acetyltransferase
MGADPFYVFTDSYFEAMGRTRGARLGLCRVPGQDDWAAAALLLDGAGVREYHLAATSDAGRRQGAASLLLHEAAGRARDAGLGQLYLGGGTDAREDNPLLFFKSGFSRRRLAYRTGAAIFDPQAYAELERRYPQQREAHPHWPIFHRKV